MSTIQATPPADAADELREPPDYESYYSGLASFVFHLCLFMILSFLADIVKTRDKLPPSVDIVQVVDAKLDDSEAFSDMPSGMETQQNDTGDPLTLETPSEKLNTDISPNIPSEFDFDNNDVQRDADQAIESARRAAAAAKSAAQKALNENLGGTPGNGGAGGAGRAGRAARWVLRFNSGNPQDYLRQLGGLDADVAFPAAGGKYHYFSNLSGQRTTSIRDLDSETRIYWIDDRTYFEVARLLGVSAQMMIAFLPAALEDKMSKLEMARARERGVTREEDIVQTVFEYVDRAGGDVVIVSQELR